MNGFVDFPPPSAGARSLLEDADADAKALWLAQALAGCAPSQIVSLIEGGADDIPAVLRSYAQALRHRLGVVRAALCAVAAVCPAAARAAHPDAELIARSRDIVALQTEIDAFWSDGATPIADEGEREERQEPLRLRQDVLVEGMRSLRPTTPEGLSAFGRAVVAIFPDLARDDGPGDYTDTHLVATLLRSVVDIASPGGLCPER